MNSCKAIINNILNFSAVDGPGNRMVVFFQGCNLACPGCHNPYTIGRCDHCGDCLPVCPEGALSWRDKQFVLWNDQACTECDRCLDVCSRSASPKTRTMDVDALMRKVIDNLPFISGLTLSGGEATLQLPFLIAFLTALRQHPDTHQLSCLLDTNGLLGIQSWQRLLPLIDGVMLDIKAWDTAAHRTVTGKDNQRVKNSLTLLTQTRKLTELRLLLAPGLSDFVPLPKPLADAVAQLPASLPIRINGFRHHGVQGSARHWPEATDADILQLQQALQALGHQNIIIPSDSGKSALL